MVEVQIGTTFLPILMTPRIGGLPVTQTQIKNDFSNAYVDDVTTPLTFTLEYKERNDALPQTVSFDASRSTDSVIYFPIPDSFYAQNATYTVLPFWNVGGPTPEKIYAAEGIQIIVKDLHKGT